MIYKSILLDNINNRITSLVEEKHRKLKEVNIHYDARLEELEEVLRQINLMKEEENANE